MRRAVRLSAAAATVAVVALVGACQGGDHATSEAPTSAVVRQHAAPDAGGATLTSATFVDAVGGAMTSPTSYDFALTMTADGRTVRGHGSGTVGGGDPSVAATLDTGEHGTVDLRVVDGKAYVSVPALTGGKFFAVDPAKLPGSLSSSFDQLTQRPTRRKGSSSSRVRS